MRKVRRRQNGLFIVAVFFIIIFLFYTCARSLYLKIDKSLNTDVASLSTVHQDHVPLKLADGNQLSDNSSLGLIHSDPTLQLEHTVKILHSPCAVLVSVKDNDILLDKNRNQKIYPASMTKIMTAMIALESLNDLDQKIELKPKMFDALYAQDASMAGFVPYEEVSVIDLLYGALLPSGAEACVGLAETVAGSEEAFAALMNEKAEQLGMDSTHFTNSTGLHDENQYSTVNDIAVLLQYSLNNETFKKIFTSKHHSTTATNMHPDGITVNSTLFKEMDAATVNGGEILGGKTGYTPEAGLCLASLAVIEDEEYVLVTAGAQGNHQTDQYNIEDALAVYQSINTEPK